MSEQKIQRRKSVGDIVKEMEGQKSTKKGSPCEIAGRLPMCKPDCVADMLPETENVSQVCENTLSKNEEEILRKLSANLINKKWEMTKICLSVIDDQEEMVKRMTKNEKMKANMNWNDEDMRNVSNLRVRNVRFLNLRNGTRNGMNKGNVLEEFCRKKGITEKKDIWRRKIEEEIEKKESEVEEMKKKKRQSKSKKRKLELFKECKECLESMFNDWKETPKRDEEKKFEELKKKVIEMKTEKKKKIQEVLEEEEKTTIHHGEDTDRAEQNFVDRMTTKGEPSKFSSISNESTISISKQKLFTKPHQQDYRSMGIVNQLNTDSTGNPTNGRGVCSETGPPGQ